MSYRNGKSHKKEHDEKTVPPEVKEAVQWYKDYLHKNSEATGEDEPPVHALNIRGTNFIF